MTIQLAQNIRTFRKQRTLTQEQLAEVLGVTVGAVYKWEAGLSLPELTMLMELAAFFDTSVDVLLGYELQDNRLEATVERLKNFRIQKNREGLGEAEKALKKYPNSFEIAYQAAAIYQCFGTESGEKQLLHRAMELLEGTRKLLPQNKDPRINDSTLCGDMAGILFCQKRPQDAVELLQKHNANGIYSDLIGNILVGDCHRPEEALPYLSEGLLRSIASLVRIVMGYTNLYLKRKDYASAQLVLTWGISLFSGLKDGEKISFLDKLNAVLLICLAFAQWKTGAEEKAGSTLIQARTSARIFDAAPEYRPDALRFIMPGEQAGVYDDLGLTAQDGAENAVASMEDPTFAALWQEVCAYEA